MNFETMSEVGLLSILADKIQELRKECLKDTQRSKASSNCEKNKSGGGRKDIKRWGYSSLHNLVSSFFMILYFILFFNCFIA